MLHRESPLSVLALMIILSVIITGVAIPSTTMIATSTPTSPASAPPEPTATLAVNGDPLASTESVTVGSDPDLTLSVSVNDSQELTTVRVAVDNKTRRTYNNSGSNQTLTRELDISLRNGAHTIAVTTTTRTDPPGGEKTEITSTSTNNNTTTTPADDSINQTTVTPTSPPTSDSNETTSVSIDTHIDRFTITVDTAAPLVAYTSPFEVDGVSPPPDLPAVTNSTVTLAGTLQDRSNVTTVQITHVYEYDFAGRSQSVRSTYRLLPANASFARPLLLGIGENEITAEYTDRFGNIRRHEITIILVDSSAPRITLDRSVPPRVGYETVQIRGTVTDAVKLNQIDLVTPSSGTERLLIRQGPEPTRKHRSVSISETVQLSPGRNYIQVDATDVGGNRREREATVFYNESIAPQVTIESVVVSDSTSQPPTARVTGRITREEIVDARIEIRKIGAKNTESPLINRSLISTAANADADTDSAIQSTTDEPQRRLQFNEEFPLRNITDPVSLRIIASDAENDTEVMTHQLSSITPQTERDSENINSSLPMPTPTPALTAVTTDTTRSETAFTTESTVSSRSSTSTPLGIIPVFGAICVIALVIVIVMRFNHRY